MSIQNNNHPNERQFHIELRQFTLNFIESGDYDSFRYEEIQIPYSSKTVFAMIDSLISEGVVFEFIAHDGETYYVEAERVPVAIRHDDREVKIWLYHHY